MRLFPEDEVTIRRVSQLAVAPDGTRVVFGVDEADLVQNNRVTRLWLQPADGAAARPLTTGHGNQRFPLWSPDGASIAFVGGPNGDRLLVVDAGGGRPRDLLPPEAELVASEIFMRPGGQPSIAWSPDGRHIACLVRAGDSVPGDLTVEGPRVVGDPLASLEITERLRGGPPVRLCVVALDGGVTEIGGAERPMSALGWSPDGQSVYAVSRSADDGSGQFRFQLQRFARQGDSVDVINTFDGAAFMPEISPDGCRFAVTGARGTTNAPSPFLAILSADDGTQRDLSTDDLTTYSDVSWSRDGSALIVVADRGVQRVIERIDAASGAATALTSGHPWIEMARSAAASDVVAFAGSALDDPGDVFLLDATGGQAPSRLTELNPQLASLDLGMGERVTWEAEDGTPIEGIALFPPGYRSGVPAPFIIDYHGGPASHVTLGWNGQRQVFAGAGYVVFAPNFRGSTGYGAAFGEALRGDIGGTPFTDSMSGVDHLLSRLSIDPERLFAYGHSWGGYMTAWTATQTDRFKAIVSSGSISDLFSVYHTRYTSSVWHWRLLGGPTKSLEQYVKWSPILHADQVTSPVLFLNGAIDRTTPPTQGQEMFTALRQRDVPSEHVVYPREGHAITEPAHQIDRMNRILAWFHRFGGPPPAAPSM